MECIQKNCLENKMTKKVFFTSVEPTPNKMEQEITKIMYTYQVSQKKLWCRDYQYFKNGKTQQCKIFRCSK